MSRMMQGRRGAFVAIVLAMLAPAAIAESVSATGSAAMAADSTAPSLDDSAVLVFPAIGLRDNAGGGDETAAFGSALVDALRRALIGRSFRVSVSAVPLGSSADIPADASSRAIAAGSAWAAVASFEIADKRIAYSLRVYDARQAALAASAGFSAFAGITALPLMDDSAKSVAAKTAAYRGSASRGEGGPVRYRISLSSPDEGASVSIGAAKDQGSRSVGVVEGGSLLLPYIPFDKGTEVVISLSGKGMESIDIPIALGDAAPKVAAPALRKTDGENFLVGTGPGRLLGLGLTYRVYTRPDWNFIFVNDRLFAGYDFNLTSVPLLHLETWYGLGWYLLFPPTSPFRLGASIGGGFLFSFSSASSPTSAYSVFLDTALMPIEGFFEYRFRNGPTVWLSVGGSYSINSSGLLGQGWIGEGKPDVTAGLLWRR
jgi:hypothetical protein